jgi:hypothetical protein
MPDVTVKLSDGIREISVEINGSDDDPLGRAEATAVRLYGVATTAVRLYGVATAGSPAGRRVGFNNWALNSDTERSPEE